MVSFELYCKLNSTLLIFCQPHNVKISNGIRLSGDSIVINTDDNLRIRYADYP